MKILHIISEAAFVDRHLEKFIDSGINNDYIFLKHQNLYNGKYTEQVKYYQANESNYQDIAQNIDKYDLVILYYLDYYKIELLNHLDASNTKILWSFYGAELYSLRELRNNFLADSAKYYNNYSSIKALKRNIVQCLQPIVWKIKNRKSPLKKIKEILPKISGFIWYNQFEYEDLNNLLGNKLPPFIECSVSNRLQDRNEKTRTQPKIIIGNSGSIYNNHIEAFKMLNKSSQKYILSLPINYGATDEYKSYLKKKAKHYDINVEFLENHLPYTEYIEFLDTHTTGIYTSYRQMGLGNIVLGIQCNLKIYLSETNPTLKWLRDIGIIIFSVEKDLLNDLNTGNLILKPDEATHNQAVYRDFTSIHNDKLYFSKLKKIVS